MRSSCCARVQEQCWKLSIHPLFHLIKSNNQFLIHIQCKAFKHPRVTRITTTSNKVESCDIEHLVRIENLLDYVARNTIA